MNKKTKYLDSLLGRIAVIATVIATISGSFYAYDNFMNTKRNNFVLTHDWKFQGPFVIGSDSSNVSVGIMYKVANLDSKPLYINDVVPSFEPMTFDYGAVKKESTRVMRLVPVEKSRNIPIQAKVYDSVYEYAYSNDNDPSKPKPSDTSPFRIEAYGYKFIRFDYRFKVIEVINEEEVPVNLSQFGPYWSYMLTILHQGSIHKRDAKCTGSYSNKKTKVLLHDNTVEILDVNTFLIVAGCTIVVRKEVKDALEAKRN